MSDLNPRLLAEIRKARKQSTPAHAKDHSPSWPVLGAIILAFIFFLTSLFICTDAKAANHETYCQTLQAQIEQLEARAILAQVTGDALIMSTVPLLQQRLVRLQNLYYAECIGRNW